MGIFDGVLLVSDLDGTLFNQSSEMTTENGEAIRQFISRGGRFTVATGRSLQGFKTVREGIPINPPAILAGGALVFDFAAQTPLRTVPLSKGFLPLCHAARSAFPNVAMEAHLVDGVWMLGENEYALLHQQIVNTRVTRADTAADVPSGWLKALFIAPHEKLTELRDWMLPHCKGKYELVFSHPLLLEMQDARAEKGESVSWLAWHLDIQHKHVYCAGDYQNDLSMLRRFHSFAPKGAQMEVRASAGHVGPSCDDHFIAWVISQLALQYRESSI